MNQPTSQPIVCGTDFSEMSHLTADVATQLARRGGARLILAHGIDERGEIPRHHWQRLSAEDRPRLEEEADRLRASGVVIHQVLLGPVPDGGLVKCAEQARARIIVVAGSSKNAFGRALMGSVTERIAETAKVPTLVVKNAAPLQVWLDHQVPLKVFVAVDFSPISENALQWAAKLTDFGPCEVTIGFVDREAEERGEEAVRLAGRGPKAPEMQDMLAHDLEEKARGYFGRQKVEVQVLPAPGRVDLRLLELARDSHADLIVVGTHQWHGLSRLVHASVSRRILHAAEINVACVPSHPFETGRSISIPKLSRVLAAVDLDDHGAEVAAHAYTMLHFGGLVCLVHILKPGEIREECLKGLRAFVPEQAAALGVQTKFKVLEERNAAEGICLAAKRLDAELVCIGSPPQNASPFRALRSTSETVIARSPVPVLTVPSTSPKSTPHT